MRRLLLLYVLLLLFAPPGSAQDRPPTMEEAVRKAVSAGKLDDSDNVGTTSDQASYRDVERDAGILVGLEIGLAKWFDREIPFAIRPIYRNGSQEVTGRAAGNFNSDEIRRRVRVSAKPDYAVGGMWLRTGAGMDRVCLHYMRIRGTGLDATDNYTSGWIGSSDGGSERYVDSGGRPIVGLFATTNEKQAHNFGFISARVPLPPPRPKDLRPAPPANAVDEEAADPEPWKAKKSKLELEEEARKEQEPKEGVGTIFIVFVVFGLVAVPLVVVLYFVLGKKEKTTVAVEDERAARPKRTAGDLSGRPVSERPELARRLGAQLPATATAPTARNPMDRVIEEPPPPFFVVRATYRARRDRMARIYVLPNEMLVIDCGSGADQNVAAGMAAAFAAGGGVVGAFVGTQVANMVADYQKAGGEVIQSRLDRLDLPALLGCATEEGNFRAGFDEVTGICIDPPRARRTGEKPSRGVGTLRFRHLRRGEYTFEFLNGAEIRGAVELLRRNSQAVRVNVGTGWDEATALYLADL
jgi:hypothetical protein